VTRVSGLLERGRGSARLRMRECSPREGGSAGASELAVRSVRRRSCSTARERGREEAAALRGDRVARIGGSGENSTLPHDLTGSSTVARKSGERELDDAGSEARSPCPEGWLTLQKLRSSRRSSSERG
jgi:hypothetical protein